ncbi:MAG: DUF2442 domain-containing protein [Chloroflexota bacterium]|nr:DUF2442 domain-containing protein [Chloroflexota bacterium]
MPEQVYAPHNDAVSAQVCDDTLSITTRDGRVIQTPIAWSPWLTSATLEQRANFKVMGPIIHWHDLDEGISMAVILLGRALQ